MEISSYTDWSNSYLLNKLPRRGLITLMELIETKDFQQINDLATPTRIAGKRICFTGPSASGKSRVATEASTFMKGKALFHLDNFGRLIKEKWVINYPELAAHASLYPAFIVEGVNDNLEMVAKHLSPDVYVHVIPSRSLYQRILRKRTEVQSLPESWKTEWRRLSRLSSANYIEHTRLRLMQDIAAVTKYTQNRTRHYVYLHHSDASIEEGWHAIRQ